MKVSILTGAANGTPYLSSYLKSHGIEAELISIDHNIFAGPSHEAVKLLNDIIIDYVKKENPDAVGMSTINLPYLTENLSKLGFPIILGGPESLKTISFLHEYYPEKQHYDFGMTGLPLDFPKLLEHIAGKEVDLNEIRGLIYFKNGKLKTNKPVWTKSFYLENKPDLEVTHPSQSLLDKTEGLPSYARLDQFWVPDMFGCPHAQCTFCSIEKPFLSFTPKEIVQLIEDVVSQSPETPIGLNSQSSHKLGKVCEEMKKQDVIPSYVAFMTRVDSFVQNYKEVVKALETGIVLDLDCIGFESFLQEDLDRLNKGITVEQNFQAVQNLRTLGTEFDNFHFRNPNAHGLIPFLPWSTPKTIYEHFKILKSQEMWDIFNPYTLTNHLQVSYNEPAKEELFKEADHNNNPNVRLLQMGSDTGYSSELVWIYNNEKMCKLIDFNRRAYSKVMSKEFLRTCLKTVSLPKESIWVKKSTSMMASKYLIESTFEIADFIVNT